MLYREIIAVCSQIHTKHINTPCGQNVELFLVKPGGTYSNHWALEGYENVFTPRKTAMTDVTVCGNTRHFVSDNQCRQPTFKAKWPCRMRVF